MKNALTCDCVKMNEPRKDWRIQFCKRCGRKLRSEESQKLGYGKVCWEKRENHLKPLFDLCDKTD